MVMSIENGKTCEQRHSIGPPIDSSFSLRSSMRIVISRSASSC